VGTGHAALAVSRVQRINGIHAHDDLCERRKAESVKGVESSVVAQVDVYLRAASVRSTSGKRERAAKVAVAHGLIGDPDVAPGRRESGVSRQPELCDEVRDYPENPDIVVKAVPYEIVEPVRSQRRPVAPHYNVHVAPGSLQLYHETVRSCSLVGFGTRLQQRRP